MSIREDTRRRALSRYSHVIGDIRVGRFAREQTQSLACLSPSDLEAAIRGGNAVLLSQTDPEWGYLGLYVPARDKIIVCAVTLAETAFEDGQPVIAELLDLDEFEHKGGAIDIEVRRRIAGRQLNPVGLRAWEAKHLDATYSWPRPRVFVYFELDGKVHTHYARRPPVCREWIDTYGLENILGHPGVWEWFRQVLEGAKIEPETVISLRVADGVKMRLDLNAEAHPCPDCKFTHFQFEPDTEADKALDADDAVADGGSPRLFDWLSRVVKGI